METLDQPRADETAPDDVEEHDEDETADDDDKTHGDETPGAAAEPEAAAPSEPINYHVEPAPVTGIIRGLAETIPAKGTLLLAIAKLENGDLLVTIQPPKTDKEGDPALPLQVKGTPTEIDASLVDALAHYVPARHIAVKTAEQIARDTADRSKKAAEAAKARTTTSVNAGSASKKKTPSITVRVEPKDATLRVVDGADVAQTVKHGVKATVAKGRYVIAVAKLGYETETKTVVVGDGPQDVTITLKQLEQTALFGGSTK
jgi:PRTRC genetic system protein E